MAFDEDDRSGSTLHAHGFVDRPPPPAGAAIPFSPGIVHATGMVLDLGPLATGAHTVWVVAGDGADEVRVPPQPVRVEVEVP